jgi:DNA-binding SARP family transcriptional activator/tetratricopeptide (TPR) repeat protein
VRAQIFVRTVGSAAIEIGRRRVGPSSGRLYGLLLYLTSRRGQASSRQVLQELLFPEANPGQSSHSLRQLLYRLRQLDVPLEADADQVVIPSELIAIDWQEIVESAAISRVACEQLAHGIFPGYSPNLGHSFREWFEAERGEITLRLSRCLTKHLSQFRASGRWDLVDGASRALLALDPLSEEGTLARAEALATTGSKSAALGVIEQYIAEIGETQPHMRVAPASLWRRISERLPDAHSKAADDRLFVGREQLMRMLSAFGTAARSGEQQILLLWGEPGIGKTRLLSEYTALASLQRGVTTFLSCQSHDIYRPLGIACDLVAQLLEAPGALGCDPDATKLLSRLVTANTATASNREAVASEASLSMIIGSIQDLVSAVASECPVVAIVDDAQWLDEGSLKVLISVFGDRAARRASLILASRDRSLLAGTNTSSNSISSLRLNALDREASLTLIRTLLSSMLGKDTADLEQRIFEQARGNPFFIRLLCSHLVATNNPSSLEQTLTQILERRLEPLSREALLALEGCVILAKNCTFSRLEKLLEVPRHQLLGAIQELDDRGLIEVDEGSILSSHALLSEAVLRRMAVPVHRALHAAVADILQTEISADNTGRTPWDCAEHWRLAGNNERAVDLLRSCAHRLFEVGRPNDALETYTRALALEARAECRLDLILRALNTVWYGMNFLDARSLLGELRDTRTKLGLPIDVHDKYEILEFAQCLHSDQDPRSNIDRLRRCVTSESLDAEHPAMAAGQLLMIADLARDADLAKFAFEATRESITHGCSGKLRELVYETCFGDPKQALRVANDLLTTLPNSSPLNAPRHVGITTNIGYAHYRVGSAVEARKYLIESREVARRNGMIDAEIHVLDLLTQLAWSIGDVDQCREWHCLLGQLRTHDGFRGVVCDYCIYGARVATVEGRFEDAERLIAEGRMRSQAKLDSPRMMLLASEMQLRFATGRAVGSESEMSELLSYHLRARHLGEQDDILIAMLHCLTERGALSRAESLFHEYVDQRRERAPIPLRLLNIVNGLSRRKQDSIKVGRPVALEVPSAR